MFSLLTAFVITNFLTLGDPNINAQTRSITELQSAPIIRQADNVARLYSDKAMFEDIEKLSTIQTFAPKKPSVDKNLYIEALKQMGYYKEDYASKSINFRNAVLRFQSDCNITVDGVIGKQFKSAFQKRLMTESYFYRDIIIAPPTEGKWIVINKDKRILTVYSGRNVVKKYPVALGRDDDKYSTPQGKYKILTKVKNPKWTDGEKRKVIEGGSKENPLGFRWIGLSIGKGYTVGIHGNNKPYSIGRDVSKGCIRMINSDVESLYDTIPRNIPVWIGTDRTLSKWGVIQNGY